MVIIAIAATPTALHAVRITTPGLFAENLPQAQVCVRGPLEIITRFPTTTRGRRVRKHVEDVGLLDLP